MVRSGPRLDRLPTRVSPADLLADRRGMFFDGYDLYVGTSVLGATLAADFDPGAEWQFVSFTFIA